MHIFTNFIHCFWVKSQTIHYVFKVIDINVRQGLGPAVLRVQNSKCKTHPNGRSKPLPYKKSYFNNKKDVKDFKSTHLLSLRIIFI
jgi:hypothetical protein